MNSQRWGNFADPSLIQLSRVVVTENHSKIVPVTGLGRFLNELLHLLAINEAHSEGDLFRTGDLQSLAGLNSADEVARL